MPGVVMVKIAKVGMMLAMLLLGAHAGNRNFIKESALEKWSFAGENYDVTVSFRKPVQPAIPTLMKSTLNLQEQTFRASILKNPKQSRRPS